MSGCGGGAHKVLGASNDGTVAATNAGGIAYKDVQPVFQKRCTPCHAFGSGFSNIAPLAKGFKSSLVYKYVVEKQPLEMPQANSQQSREITDQERQLIGQWVLAGSPETAATQSNGSTSPSLTSTDSGTQTSAEQNPAIAMLQTCWSCHGQGGQSSTSAYPNLAGQSQDYLMQQLRNYRNGSRTDRTTQRMNQVAAALTDEDIRFLASYFSFMKPPEGAATPQSWEDAKKARQLAHAQSCDSCHSPQSGFTVPNLVGQNAEYFESQFANFKIGSRRSIQMWGVAQELSPAEVHLLATWFAHGAPQ